MSVTPVPDVGQEVPAPQGHTVGFVDTEADCDAIIEDLYAAGIPDSSIAVLRGADGVHLLQRMMGSSLWGEAAEKLLKQGTIEIGNGHIALIIDTQDRDEAVQVADISSKHGGHNFNHFGTLVDERLTR